MEKVELIGADLETIQELMSTLKEPPFRAKQIMQWIYHRGRFDFHQMGNLPKTLRDKLDETASIALPRITARRISRDGTQKYLLELEDGATIETVLIPEGNRRTLCVSSQVGCAMDCRFCATGAQGFQRNLTVGEMVGQVLVVQKDSQDKITNIVLMGMGEPLANYEQVMGAVRLWNDPLGLGIAARRLTISTCGLVPGIERLSREGLQVVLAVSLHAPNDDLRNQIMPINRRYNLSQLMDVCRQYVEATNRRITFEYALMQGFNDSLEHARQLAQLIKGILCHVNIIPLNPVNGHGWASPTKKQVLLFQQELARYNIEATVRAERGADIEAACGQLKSRLLGKEVGHEHSS
ncbi:MAG: 23S rRNA (adenine(2503)-C(2))-methyltransferase RlmN [Firmicutes bacterium]|jgi:23S rRNA (adenine2503-C2)-methyltransferase|nr:23S rRNA (adenine(2503)-C(2))-methyltransferase RlmN [Bacillota bacterium]